MLLKAFNKLIFALALSIFAILFCRLIFILSALAYFCPEGSLRVVQFYLVGSIIILGPGLLCHRFLYRGSKEFENRALFILSMGVSISGIFSWVTYVLGVHTTEMIIAFVCISILLGVVGIFPFVRKISIRNLYINFKEYWERESLFEHALLVVLVCVLCGYFEYVVGTPFKEWDAIVSWDKWSTDMAIRDGLGHYAMGGYPQFLPSLHSVFYQISNSARAILPPEQGLLHGFTIIFPIILLLALRSIGRAFNFSGNIAFALFIANTKIFADLLVGQVDIPLVAFIASGCAIAINLSSYKSSVMNFWVDCIVFGLIFFVILSIKTTGLLWLPIIILTVAYKHKCICLKRLFVATSIAVIFAAPYSVHQFYLSFNTNLIESSPFLHTFLIEVVHKSAFSTTFNDLFSLWTKLLLFFRMPSKLFTYSLIIFSILALRMLISKKTFIHTILAFGLFVLWFFTASYDFRNAYPIFCLVAILSSIILSESIQCLKKHKLNTGKTILCFCVSVVCICGIVSISWIGFWKSSLSVTHQLLSKPEISSSFKMDPKRRHNAFRSQGRVSEILLTSPIGVNAKHILVGDFLYRVLGTQGVYLIQHNAFNELMAGDLAIAHKKPLRPLPPKFVPIASFVGCNPYSMLYMYSPQFIDISYQLEAVSSNRYKIKLDSSLTEITPTNCGIVEITFKNKVKNGDITLRLKDMSLDPFSIFLNSINEGRVVRFIYWCPQNNDGKIPEFELQMLDKTNSIKFVKFSPI